MTKISVVINTLNEEKNLPKAMASVRGFADEIVVVDMESADATVSIAKKLGAKVFSHPAVGYVEPARNFALRHAQGEWILILDADEEIPRILADKLKRISADAESADYYRLPRKNIIFGKWIKHSRWWPDYNIRFFKKGHVSWNEVIHAVPMTRGRGADIPAKEALALVHNNYPTLEIYLERMNRYTTIQSKLLTKEGYKFNWKDLVRKPLSEFLGRYFAGEGYKDGIHGLVLSFLQAFSEFVVYLKVWQEAGAKQENLRPQDLKKELNSVRKDLTWWFAKVGGKNILTRMKKRVFP